VVDRWRGKTFGQKGTFYRVVGAAGVRFEGAHGFDAVLVVAGEHDSARGHAPGGVVGGGEAHALRGELVDVRSLDPGVGFFVAAKSAVRVVVGIYEKDIGGARASLRLGIVARRARRGREGRAPRGGLWFRGSP
jgi:hypothetical protein